MIFLVSVLQHLNKILHLGFVKDGGWAPWGAYSTCTVTCGDGTMKRRRTCTKPKPLNGGRECVGRSTETTNCNEKACLSK